MKFTFSNTVTKRQKVIACFFSYDVLHGCIGKKIPIVTEVSLHFQSFDAILNIRQLHLFILHCLSNDIPTCFSYHVSLFLKNNRAYFHSFIKGVILNYWFSKNHPLSKWSQGKSKWQKSFQFSMVDNIS